MPYVTSSARMSFQPLSNSNSWGCIYVTIYTTDNRPCIDQEYVHVIWDSYLENGSKACSSYCDCDVVNKI